MVITSFKIINSKDYIHYFEKIFLIIDISQLVIINIFFLKLKNLDIS